MTERALRDLRDHYDHVALSDPVAAKRLLVEINTKIHLITELGLTGVPWPFIPDLRALPFKNRCIYFLIGDGVVTVLRVKHGRQNTSPTDFPESDS